MKKTLLILAAVALAVPALFVSTSQAAGKCCQDCYCGCAECCESGCSNCEKCNK